MKWVSSSKPFLVRPKILTREHVSQLLSCETFTYGELRTLLFYALAWSRVKRAHALNLLLDDVDLGLGIFWVNGDPWPIQPETKKFIEERWLPHRLQKGNNQLLLTNRYGDPYTTGWHKGISLWRTVTLRVFPCSIRDRDLWASLLVNLMAENPGLSVRRLAEVYYLNPNSYFLYNLQREYLPLLGDPPCSQPRWKNRDQEQK